MTDKQTITTNAIVTGLVVTGAQLASGKIPTIRPALGLAITTGILLIGVDSSPGFSKLARQFSTLIVVTAVLTSGGILAKAIVGYFGSDTAATQTGI
jgi:hypothetical protein